VFNLLGPMASPGRIRRQVIGVANAAFAERMVETLRTHGSVHSWVVHGGGLDELTTTGPSDVIELRDGEIDHFRIDPAELGLAPAQAGDLTGGDRPFNADVVHRVLSGESGAHRDIVTLNAAAGLVVGGRAATIADGLTLAADSIDSGAAAETLSKLIATSQAGVA
jgi:anthranilate phosphoribosyltransferase